MPTMVEAPDYATFINVFRCRPADQDEVVRINVEIVERVAMGSPGFVSASVHRSTDGTRVFNYLQWESSEPDLATNSPAYGRNRDVRKTPSGSASTWPASRTRGGGVRSQAEKRSTSSVWHNAARR